MFKHPKLEKSSDYIQWHRRLKAYQEQDNYKPSFLTPRTGKRRGRCFASMSRKEHKGKIENHPHNWGLSPPEE